MFCRKCGVTTIVDHSLSADKFGGLLEGKCKTCGNIRIAREKILCALACETVLKLGDFYCARQHNHCQLACYCVIGAEGAVTVRSKACSCPSSSWKECRCLILSIPFYIIHPVSLMLCKVTSAPNIDCWEKQPVRFGSPEPGCRGYCSLCAQKYPMLQRCIHGTVKNV